MILTIDKESPFQVMNTAFTIGVSESGYMLQFSADGYEWADKMSVEANVVKVVQKVAGGAYWRLMGNTSKVTVNYYKERSSTPAPSPTPTPSVEEYLTMTVSEDDITVYISDSSVQYSYDKKEWLPLTETITVANGESIHFWRESSDALNQSFSFGGNGMISLSGKLSSLLNFSTVIPEKGFFNLFANCSNLIDASNLIIEFDSIGEAGMQWCFGGCTNLLYSPTILDIPTGEYICYANLFDGCSNLLTVPVLPMLTVPKWGYNSIFAGCSNINEIWFYATYVNGMYPDWDRGVASNGTIHLNNAATESQRTSILNYIPSGWTVIWEDVE